MNKKNFLNSNREVILYFIRLVNRLTPQYMPTLVVQSLLKTLRPLIYIFGPKLIVDELMGLQRVDRLVMIIAGIAIGNYVLSVAERWMQFRTQFLTDKFNNAFERHISKKTAEIDYQNIEDPDILNLKERALFAIRNHWLMGSMINALSAIANEVMLILSLVVIIWTFSPWVLLLLVGVVIINSFLFKRVQHYYYTESTQTVSGNRAFVYYISQSADLEIAKDLRLYDMSHMVVNKMNKYNINIYKLYLKIYGTISKLNGFVSVNVQIQTVIIYFLLAAKALKGTMSIGNFMMYAGTIGKFGLSMNTCVSSIIEVNRLCRQLELLVEYEKIPSSKDSGDQVIPDDCKYEIEFHNVSFKYPKASTYTLKNISVKINQGEKISIIGKNGAGKTTFVKLLTRLYKPSEGKITLDGVNIQDLDYDDYMSKIAAVFQDYRLFGITVEENITGKLTTDELDHSIKSVLTDVGMEKDVKALKYGAKTALDKGYDKKATKLSGGQSQKLAIARALYKDAQIVVLDEPTAALDPIAEHDVYCRFDELVQGRTAIYISHRLSSCRFCDRILVFDQGEIIQVGSHDELIKHVDSAYEVMFNAQATYYSA